MKDILGYEGKTCVVLGCAHSMGKEGVKILKDLGAYVIGMDIDYVDCVPCDEFIQVDLGCKESVDKAFTELGAFDKFFAYAAVSGFKNDKVSTISINFLSYKYFLENYVFEKINRNGAIALVSSIAGNCWEKYIDEYLPLVNGTWEDGLQFVKDHENDISPSNAYQLSKRALIYFTNTVACKLYADKQVRINTVAPGYTHTRLRGEFSAFGNWNTAAEKAALEGSITRDSEPEEQANAMIFLNSNMATGINNLNLNVDGGLRGLQLAKLHNDVCDAPYIVPGSGNALALAD